mmetsp:Transcript_2347/g.5727  ORF Transcript_2347/g.5727 Transcript_2347/m.5727 type:complete len:81 (+) Transcript_2347:1-243(+)
MRRPPLCFVVPARRRTAYVLDVDAARWYDVSAAFTFAPRAGHQAVCHGADVVFWGGGDNDEYFHDTQTVPLKAITALCKR